MCFLETAKDAGTSEEVEKEYLSELNEAGVYFEFIGSDARRFPWRGIRRMRNYVHTNHADIYHAHLTYGILFGALVRVPRVYTHHSVSMRIGRLVFALMNPLIDQLVGISNKCAKVLSAHTGRKPSIIINGVSFQRFSQQDLRPRKIGQRISCISVGRICEEKNYELLVRAIARLPDGVRSNLSVKIAGAGPKLLAAKLEKRISDEGLGDVILLLGNRSDIPALLASSQLFLMSSSSEGLPIALIEASVAGLPCVVTDVGGCSEIVDLCRNGIVVAPESPQALARAIENIISDPTQFTKLSANALDNSKVFSIVAASESHITLYECLLSSQDDK